MDADVRKRLLMHAALVGALLLGGIARAAESPPLAEPPAAPPPPAPEAEGPYQVVIEGRQRVRWLDPAVFTEISPVTVPEIGIRLPPDQED